MTYAASGRRIANAVVWQMGGRILGTVATIATIALTTRALGTVSYGHLNTAIFYVGLWTSLTELGIGVVIVRRVSSGEGSLSRLVGVNLGFSLAYCIPLTALAAISALLVYPDVPELRAMLLIVSISLTLTTVASCLNPVFMSSVRFSAVGISDLLSRLAVLVFTGALVVWHASPLWYAAAQIIPPAVQLIVQGIAAHRIVPLRIVLSVRETWALVRESLPQTAVLIIGVLYWRIDGVILSLLSTATEVARYGLAYQAAFTLSVMGNFFLGAALSTMSNLYATDRERFGRFVERSMGLMLSVAVPIAVVGFFVGPEIIAFFGTEEFLDKSNLVLPLLLVCVGLTFLTGTVSQALFAAHHQVFLMRLNLFNLVANIALNIALIPHLGSLGAAIALIVSEVVGLVVANFRLASRTPYRTPWLFLLRLVPPTLAAVGALLLAGLWMPQLLAAALAAFVYVVVNLVSGPVYLRDVREILRRDGAVETDGAQDG